MVCPVTFGSMIRQYILISGADGVGVCSSHGGQEAKRKRGSQQGSYIPFEGTPLLTPLITVLPPFNSVTGWQPSLQHMAFGGHLRSK
jgi:hypothetical protein